MGGSYAAAGEASAINKSLEESLYLTARPALEAGTNYLTGAYNQGGFDQSAKYQGKLTNAAEGSLGGSIFSGNLGTAAGQRANTFAGIGGAKIASGIDEMNKLRSLLAQKGLRTTNLAQEAGSLSVSAIPQMAQNPTLSAILGVGAAGASIYGGLQQAGGQSDVANVLRQQTFGDPLAGSDRSYLTAGGGGMMTAPWSNNRGGGGG